MLHALMMTVALASVGYPQPVQQKPAEGMPAHEKAEDKARTVPGGASKGVEACHADIERWCKKIKPGDGRLGACLKANAKKLSKRCKRWASHGGAAHMDEAFARDIDGAPPAPASGTK